MSIEEFWFPVNIPFEENINWNTLVTAYEDGKEQRRQKWSTPKRAYAIALKGRTNTIMQQVWDFYVARAGAYDTFYFENPNESPKSMESSQTVATGTNDTFQFANYPWISGDIVVYKNSVASGDENTDWTIDKTNGRITFVANRLPEADAVIAADYAFARVVRFADDKLNRQMFNYKLFNSSLKLIEVL